MTTPLNEAVMRLTKRAEMKDRATLIQTFVDVGPLFLLLSGIDHQVIFGRRGTGKTHALSYLADSRDEAGDISVLVDLRNIGSSGGIYSDQTISVPERATRLLVDTLRTIHDSILTFVLERDAFNLAEVSPALDELADAITQVRVIGTVESEAKIEETEKSRTSLGLAANFDLKKPGLSFKSGSEGESHSSDSRAIKRKGAETHYVNFGNTGFAFRKVVEAIGGKRLWIILDEWGSVPSILQPFLADLLRRSVFPVKDITVKIAAIEHRAIFQQFASDGNYIGIELGADAAADVNLDDFMVFDNDNDRATEFFRQLVGRHLMAIAAATPGLEIPESPEKIMQALFTEKRAIEEFVRACEGVPRDAINILSLAAQKAASQPISVANIRTAARNWYQRDKERAISSNDKSHKLLTSIIREVIGDRKARAFLFRSNASDDLIDALYDGRVLHILKRGISSNDQPGIRYDAYKLDYGCYVDLIATSKAPQGLLQLDFEESDTLDPDVIARYVEVPPDDYRSIRRAILDVERLKMNSGI